MFQPVTREFPATVPHGPCGHPGSSAASLSFGFWSVTESGRREKQGPSSHSWGSDHGGRPGSGMRGPSPLSAPRLSASPSHRPAQPRPTETAPPRRPGVSVWRSHARRGGQLLVWGSSSSSPFFREQPLLGACGSPCSLSNQERLAPLDPRNPQPRTPSSERIASGHGNRPAPETPDAA